LKLPVADMIAPTESALVATGVRKTFAGEVAFSAGQAEADGTCSHRRRNCTTGQYAWTPVGNRVGPTRQHCLSRCHESVQLRRARSIRRAGRRSRCGRHLTVNSPARAALWGGVKAVAPTLSGPPLVIDRPATTMTRGEVLLATREDREFPVRWALNAAGEPTTDPHAALKGTLLPAGDHKSVCIALLVEILAAALTGSPLSAPASWYRDGQGGPPATAQFFISIDPLSEHVDFSSKIDAMLSSITSQEGCLVPGARLFERRHDSLANGFRVDEKLVPRLTLRSLKPDKTTSSAISMTVLRPDPPAKVTTVTSRSTGTCHRKCCIERRRSHATPAAETIGRHITADMRRRPETIRNRPRHIRVADIGSGRMLAAQPS